MSARRSSLALRCVLAAHLLLAPLVSCAGSAPRPGEPLVDVDSRGIAMQGYDPVSYFPEGGGVPQPGSSDVVARHAGAIYRFAGERSRKRFLDAPTRYVPLSLVRLLTSAKIKVSIGRVCELETLRGILEMAAQYDHETMVGGMHSPESGITFGTPSKGNGNATDTSIDALVHQRTRILNVKLQVFAAEIQERLRLRSSNLYRLLQNELNVRNLIIDVDPVEGSRTVYEPLREKVMLNQRLMDMDRERRDQDVACWKDVAFVMRDFLTAWEGREQAQARAMFLEAAETGSDRYPGEPNKESVLTRYGIE